MNFLSYKPSFDAYMGVKEAPNEHEKYLYKRAKRSIAMITWVPGLRMIAIVNSLSMYATHKNSDIDLFIVTEPRRMWLARFLITAIFYFSGVWRHSKDIAGNFCLSFWIEDPAIKMKQFAIEDDIYFYFWMYYMKPILVDETIWDEFRQKNRDFTFLEQASDAIIFRKQRPTYTWFGGKFLDILDSLIRFFGRKKSERSYIRKGKPFGVILSEHCLKFHDEDRRIQIREEIFHSSESLTHSS